MIHYSSVVPLAQTYAISVSWGCWNGSWCDTRHATQRLDQPQTQKKRIPLLY